ncbi:Sgf11 (transcriptional regulation protein) family protein [Acanthocheilonema viteae]
MVDGEGDEGIIRNAADINEMSEQVFEYLLGTVLLEPCFKVHRIAKITNAVLPPPIDVQNEPTAVGEYDIFGSALNSQTKHQKNMDVVCDECKRPIAASRFAPHLEKCMGMGRSSSRVARRRINQAINYTNSMKASLSASRLREYSSRESDMDHSDEDSHHTAADDDEDWTSNRRSRKSRKTKSRNRTKTIFY